MSLAEVVIALGLSVLLLAAVCAQLVESATLSLRTSHSVEHSRGARELTARVSADVTGAQIVRLYEGFASRGTPRRDGETGDYLVLHWIERDGTTVRTVGYYAVPAPDGVGWLLYRHDSADGVVVAGTLPDPGTVGTHRLVNRAIRLPDANRLFRCWRDRGVSFRGEFGTGNDANRGTHELVSCTISTRS
jgi:hypothetical protein